MAYSILADIEELLPETTIVQLTDDEDLGTINEVRVTEAIASADAEIDTYCGTKYSVPFSPVPPVIKKCSVDMAIYNLYSRKAEELPQTRTDRYKNAIRLLEAIAKGTISIGEIPEPTASEDASSAECNKTSSDRIFTRDKLEGF